MTAQTLPPQAAHEHHERLLQRVNRMPEMADRACSPPRPTRPSPDIDEMRAFLTGTLAPPHRRRRARRSTRSSSGCSRTATRWRPMRREHAEIRALVGEFGGLVDGLRAAISLGRTLALRRVLFQLYALLKVHLAEEEVYLRIVERGVPDDVADAVAAALEHPVAGR